jgi:uncharacterized protein
MRALAAVLCLLLAYTALAADVPFLSGRVVDNAEMLSPAAVDRVSGLLKAHETRTTDQVVVLTVPSLEGRSIEEYAVEVFQAWKLGQKSKDNGVLLVIVPRERKMRIEVGYGLEGRLTDVAASRIIRNVIAPQFKAGAFDQGVEEGVTAILMQLRGEGEAVAESNADAAPAQSGSGFQGPDLSLGEKILFGAFIFGIIGLFTVIGVLTPGMGWFLYLFLIPFWAMFPMVILGVNGALTLLGVYLVGFPLAKLLVSRSAWYERARKDLRSKGRANVGGFVIGGSSGSSSWSSGSSWSSSSSSGGFSGGGGSSGGGGGSGSW